MTILVGLVANPRLNCYVARRHNDVPARPGQVLREVRPSAAAEAAAFGGVVRRRADHPGRGTAAVPDERREEEDEPQERLCGRRSWHTASLNSSWVEERVNSEKFEDA